MASQVLTDLLDPPAKRHLPPDGPPAPVSWWLLLGSIGLLILVFFGLIWAFAMVMFQISCTGEVAAHLPPEKCGHHTSAPPAPKHLDLGITRIIVNSEVVMSNEANYHGP